MHFVVSVPWPVKLALFGIATFKTYPAPPADAPPPEPLAAATLHACLGAVAVCVLASVLPSLCFSVPDRRATTTFVAQTALMLGAIAGTLTSLRRSPPDTSVYACFCALVLLTHLLLLAFAALARKPQLLIYSRAVGAGALALALALVCVLAARAPAFKMHGLAALALLFAGEVLGLAVFVLDAVLRAVADGVETTL